MGGRRVEEKEMQEMKELGWGRRLERLEGELCCGAKCLLACRRGTRSQTSPLLPMPRPATPNRCVLRSSRTMI